MAYPDGDKLEGWIKFRTDTNIFLDSLLARMIAQNSVLLVIYTRVRMGSGDSGDSGENADREPVYVEGESRKAAAMDC
jgi:hypothetical protein